MASDTNSSTQQRTEEEQPKQRVSVSNEKKAHPASANAQRLNSEAKAAAKKASEEQYDTAAKPKKEPETAQQPMPKPKPKKRSARIEAKQKQEAEAKASALASTCKYQSAEDVQRAVDDMRAFFATGTTLPLHYRRATLEKLRSYLKKHEDEALQALRDDLGKSTF